MRDRKLDTEPIDVLLVLIREVAPPRRAPRSPDALTRPFAPVLPTAFPQVLKSRRPLRRELRSGSEASHSTRARHGTASPTPRIEAGCIDGPGDCLALSS